MVCLKRFYFAFYLDRRSQKLSRIAEQDQTSNGRGKDEAPRDETSKTPTGPQAAGSTETGDQTGKLAGGLFFSVFQKNRTWIQTNQTFTHTHTNKQTDKVFTGTSIPLLRYQHFLEIYNVLGK